MQNRLPKVSAVIVAAGSGLRFGGEKPKQLTPLVGRPVLSRTVAVFDSSPVISEIILVLPEKWLEACLDEAIRPFGFSKVRAVCGGFSRTESTRLGFEASVGEVVLVHDGVRPLVDHQLIAKVALAAWAGGAALAAVPLRDTLKKVDNGQVLGTISREKLWRAQTPQGFRRMLLAEALKEAGVESMATDDVELVERLGKQVAVVESNERNLKITTPEDLKMAEFFLSPQPVMRCGHGYDLHRLEPGRPLFLACVEVPFEQGLLGHSDADVVAHALVDALLGAACLGDIGQHFSDQDEKWAGASGALLLAETMAKVRAAGFELTHADVTLVGEKPKIGPFRSDMRQALAKALSVAPDIINIKATTTEGLEATGQGLALAAHATATLATLAINL